MTPLQALEAHGQSVWIDFLARRFIADGRLKELIERDGLKGVTSNPAIFEKAIDSGADYDDGLRAAERGGDRAPDALYELLAIADIQSAADVLRPVYDATDRRDGFVSLEVSPYLALDTDATIAEARRLWRAVRRDNVMIKVPATEPGLPAIRRLLGEGININITLLFSQTVYEKVAECYLAGAEQFAADGGDLTRLASVASFFVSRIDTAVDRLIGERRDDALSALEGKVAIANAKLAYQRYRRIFAGERWTALGARGARPQRLLWASTGTKNKAYSDVHYVEPLIGRDTVNTLPPATMDAFRDHGRADDTIERDVADAEQVLAALARGGISLEEVCAKLVVERRAALRRCRRQSPRRHRAQAPRSPRRPAQRAAYGTAGSASARRECRARIPGAAAARFAAFGRAMPGSGPAMPRGTGSAGSTSPRRSASTSERSSSSRPR